MQQVNPDIRNQYDWWRGARGEKGEDPTDWDAFRTHITAIGQPDPGNRPPDDWAARTTSRRTPSGGPSTRAAASGACEGR